MSVRRPALLLPYGLKSWLYAVTRAVVHQKPSDVTEFIATYCQKLYEFGREHPELSIHDLTCLFREVEEGEPASRTFSGSSASPQDREPLFYDDWNDLLAERKLSISSFIRDEISQSYETSRHIQDVNQSDVDPVLSEDLIKKELSCSATSLRSAVFQRSATPCHAEVVKNSVVICTAPSPPDQVIVIHSDTLPDTIIFHAKGAVSSELSTGSGSDFVPPTSDQDHVRESFDAGAFADVVIYNKVPSIGDLPYPLSISEDLSSPAVDLDLDQAEAAQNEISETDPSAKVMPCMLSTKIQKEVTEDVSETRVKWRSATASPEISFTTVHKQVSDTAVMKLLRPCMLGLSDDSGVDSYVRVTEVMTENLEKEAESRVPQNTPELAGKEYVSALAASDMTIDSLLAIASSNEQLNDAEIHPECLQHAMDELLEQSLEEHGRQDLGKSLSDVRVTEAARSVVSSMIDQLLAQDILETCARATVTEHMKGIQSDLVEDLPLMHDTEKEVSSVCSTITEPSLEALVLHWCERSVEEILFKAEMQMEHMVPATRLEYLEDREMSVESPEKEQTLRISPEPFLTEEGSPVTAESELKMDPSTDEQLSDAERLQVCELEHPQHEVPEPVLEELESALEHTFEPVPSTDEHQTDAEINQQGAVLLSVAETFEEEISPSSAEAKTASPEAEKHTDVFPSERSSHELVQTEKGQLSTKKIPSHSDVVQLSVSQTCEEETSPSSTKEETVSSPEAVRPTVDFPGEESAHELEQKGGQGQSSTEMFPSHSGVDLFSETCEEETLPSTAERETTSPEEVRHTMDFPGEESAHELKQIEEEGQSSTETLSPSHSGVILLSVSESCDEEISPSSEEEKTTSSPEAVRHTVVFLDEESAHELEQKGQGQLSTEMFPSHSGVILLSVSETREEEISPSSAKEKTAASPEAVRHTVDFPGEESSHELKQSSTEKMFPSRSGEDFAEKASLVATEALEIRDGELQCRRGESEEIISEAEMEMEHIVDHEENSLEAPLESPRKEETLIVSLEAFLTDDDGMAATGSLFQKVQQRNESEIPQESELECPQHEVPEPRPDEHDLEAIQPSEVLKSFEEEPSTSSSEYKNSSETEGYTILGAVDESFYELLLTEEEENSSSSYSGSEKTSDSSEEIKKATKEVTEKHLALTDLRSYLKKRKAESSHRMQPVDQQLFARMGLASTDEPCLKRIKSAGAQIVRNALAEKNRFMKRLSHSFQLAHKPSAAKDAMTATRHANEYQKLQKGRKQPFSAGTKPPRSRRTNLPEVAKQQGSDSQVWTLYRVAQASDTSLSSLTTQTSSQSSDADSELDFKTKRLSHDPGINLSEDEEFRWEGSLLSRLYPSALCDERCTRAKTRQPGNTSGFNKEHGVDIENQHKTRAFYIRYRERPRPQIVRWTFLKVSWSFFRRDKNHDSPTFVIEDHPVRPLPVIVPHVEVKNSCSGMSGADTDEKVFWKPAVTIHRGDSLKASQNWQVKRDESQNSASAESRVSDSSDCCPQEDVVITEMMS
ncbi:hypothetical protein AOLI_G00105980 [Acnodon oligacanthus]